MARLTCQSRYSVAMVVGGFEAVVQLVHTESCGFPAVWDLAGTVQVRFGTMKQGPW
jgi:hypothetical protein